MINHLGPDLRNRGSGGTRPSHGAVARQYGISRVWVGKLVARWRVGGWEAVERQSTRPKSNPHAAFPAAIEAVLALRAQLSADGLDAGPHTLRAHLQRRGLPTPRRQIRPTQRQPPTRPPKTPDMNKVRGHPLTMSRDFAVVAGAGFEPATSGL
jgi:hypothetical protein